MMKTRCQTLISNSNSNKPSSSHSRLVADGLMLISIFFAATIFLFAIPTIPASTTTTTSNDVADYDAPPPLAPFPDIPDEDVASFPLPRRLDVDSTERCNETVETFYDDGDDDDDHDDYDDDDDVAFSVYEIDGAGEEEDEEEEDEYEEDGDGEPLRHERNKRFVVTRSGSRRRHAGSGRARSSSPSESSSRRGPSEPRGSRSPSLPSTSSGRKESVESHGQGRGQGRGHGHGQGRGHGHGHAEGGGRRGGRGIKFIKRVNVRRKTSKGRSSSSSSSPTSSSSTSSRGTKHSLPEQPIWQIKWPRGGMNSVRTAIRDNQIFKDEVMKLKLKIGSLTEEQKKKILDQHNKYRGQLPGVRDYPISEIPRAQDMQKMVWDKDLEEKAKIHAEKCLFAHDTRKERHLDNLIVGQNIAADTSANFVEKAVAKWYGEIALCKWDLSGEAAAKNQDKRCTEYAQMVWANTSRLGCASVWCPEIADWPNTGYNLVCDYGPEGNVLRRAPYTPAENKGEICKKCPGKCRRGLCDCGGKVCYNGGSLDVSTCECSCTSLWKGPTCLDKSCPLTDPEACGLPYPKGYPKAYCDQYHDVTQECPYMCGVCKGERCGGKRCVNGGTLDLKTCECKCRKIFGGDTCNVLQCPPKDSWFCGTTWDKSYCRRIITAHFECPYMCNICRK